MSTYRCERAGCPGSYGPDGSCDRCGEPALATGPADPPGTEAAMMTAGGASRRTSSNRRSLSRGGLGAGLIDLTREPLRDPATAVLADPKVSESRRFCGRCGKPVGRGQDGSPGPVEGSCPNCGARFSFRPGLSTGDVVDDRYEILGCLAYGGLGWIYLARDRHVSDTVSDRWVVLKGLINTHDVHAMAAAEAERRFLVGVDHPNIVKIHDFVRHPDRGTGTVVGYIVMEYVGGRSLRDILLDHRPVGGPREALPLAQVIAYGVEILPALGYLHDRDLLFCDFKPENVIHAEEQLKLIDLGAVRHVDDYVSVVYGTPGYQAPELMRRGPSVATDLYTVGRSLAVLSFDFTGFTTRYADRLPEPADVPLLAREESYHRLLRRATDPDPDRRFRSAAEMREQLLGVLREVLSAGDGVPRPAPSTEFTPEVRAFGTEAGIVDRARPLTGFDGAAVAAALPRPQVDTADPGAGFLATLSTTDPDELVRALDAAPAGSVEVALRVVRARIERGDLARATTDLDKLAADDPTDWRVDWYRGLVALVAGRSDDARSTFSAVYDALPGEPAPKLAAAAAAEWSGDLEVAARLYERVWRADRGYVSAAFGLARIRLQDGDRPAAVTVLDEVPDSSSYHGAAQVAAVRARLTGSPATLTEIDLLDASARLERLPIEPGQKARLTVEALETALAWITAGPAAGPVCMLGHELTERGLRLGLERAYRLLAKAADDPYTRTLMVDRANACRPRTLT